MKIKATPGKDKVVVELESKDVAMPLSLPFKLQRILVPVDFSETAKKALQYALPFAKAFDAELVLVYVIQSYSLPPEIGYVPPELLVNQGDFIHSAREELDKWRAREIGGRARAQARVCEGVPWQEVVTVARETNADLIIMATHGLTGLKHALLGSVTERVARHAPCPVLVVRERERDFVSPAPKVEAPV